MVDVGDGDGAARARAAAADRRRDDLAPAHGGADRARLLARDGARPRREPRRRRRLRRCSTPRGRTGLDTENRELAGAAARAARREDAAVRCSRSRPRGQTRELLAFDDLPTPPFIGTRTVEPEPGRAASPYIDWQFFFHAWDLKGKFPAILDNPAARELYDDAPAALDGDHRDGDARRRAASTASGRRTPRATTSSSATRASVSSASRPTTATSRPNRCLADYVAPAGRPRSARSRSRSTVPTSSRTATSQGTTTTRRSSSRRWPTGWPRRSPSGCTSARAASGTRPTSSSAPSELCTPGGSVASGRRSAIRRAPITARRGSCSTCSARKAIGMDLTESFAMTPAAAVSGLYFAHPDIPLLLGRHGSAATSWRTTLLGRASPCPRSNAGFGRISARHLAS